MNDPVNHPTHYKAGSIEAIDVIEAFDLGFHLGNTVKYVLRADRKGRRLEDLRKARWYLDREIANLEEAQRQPARAFEKRSSGTQERDP